MTKTKVKFEKKFFCEFLCMVGGSKEVCRTFNWYLRGGPYATFSGENQGNFLM